MVNAREAATNRLPGPKNRVLDFIASTGVFYAFANGKSAGEITVKEGFNVIGV